MPRMGVDGYEHVQERPEPPDWSAAKCRGMGPDVFYAEKGPGVHAKIAEAKAACAACPIRRACLDFALSSNERFGVWGGWTEMERRPMRRAWLARQGRMAVA